MKLAKKFTFLHQNQVASGPLYTAEDIGDGYYAVSWNHRDECSTTYDSTIYNSTIVARYIVNGVWRVKEVFEGEMGTPVNIFTLFTLSDSFTVAASGSGAVYHLTRLSDTKYEARGEETGYKFSYGVEEVVKYINEGLWIVQPPKVTQPSLDTPETEAWPFPVIVTEVLPLLSPEQVRITLKDIRQFAEDTGFRVEVCEDFYTVRKEGWESAFVVDSEERLTAVMQSIRTLHEAADHG